MLKILATTAKKRNKSNNKNHQKDCSTVFLSSWTSSSLLGPISSKEKLMKTFADLLVAGKKLLPLFAEG